MGMSAIACMLLFRCTQVQYIAATMTSWAAFGISKRRMIERVRHARNEAQVIWYFARHVGTQSRLGESDDFKGQMQSLVAYLPAIIPRIR